MNQTQFESTYREGWSSLDQWLKNSGCQGAGWRWWLPGGFTLGKRAEFDEEAVLFPERFRQLCQHVALARSRNYSHTLVEELNALAARAHHRLYAQSYGPNVENTMRFAMGIFPRAIWENRGYVLAASLAFVVPLIVMFMVCLHTETGIYSVMSYDAASQYEWMYSADQGHGFRRDAQSDVRMFGYYIYNNIGVAFRTFAAGLLLGVGSLFFLVFNGISIGAVAGHLTQAGLAEPFFSFVSGHSAFELTAIVFAGAAGFKLGDAFFKPGRFNRGQALRVSARQSVPLMYGVGIMLVVAAALEAFWSPSALVPSEVKYVVGCVLWVVVIAYSFSGRRFVQMAREHFQLTDVD